MHLHAFCPADVGHYRFGAHSHVQFASKYCLLPLRAGSTAISVTDSVRDLESSAAFDGVRTLRSATRVRMRARGFLYLQGRAAPTVRPDICEHVMG